MLILFIYCIAGLLIGFLSGLLGIGGGLIAVPALSMLLVLQGVNHSLIMHIAVATSLSTIIFTSLASIRTFHQQGEVAWDLIKILLPGVILGTLLGTFISQHLSTNHLRFLFGLFVLIVAFRLFFQKKEDLKSHTPHPRSIDKADLRHHRIAAVATGLTAGLLGVGGSIIIIPYLLHKGFTIRQASGTSITCAFPIALIATLVFSISGWHIVNLPPYSTGYVNWSATLGLALPSLFSVSLGAWLGKRAPQTTLRKLFSLFLVFVSLDMLLG
ncbi:MAG: sulfite exporter TauE/SafE family protein [Gammaproteobacteria bacterium]|nr:sulfite exporter TauE/SafE family protein [Gammaproteobacteria bacterium]